MKKKTMPLIVGNWKMNPQSLSAAKRLFLAVKKGVARIEQVSIAVAPPAIYLAELQKAQSGSKKIMLGAQSVYWEKAGAHTGETSVPMLKDIGVAYVIIGHSERRAKGISDEAVHKSLNAVLKTDLVPIVCIGEQKRDSHGNYFTFVEQQIRAALQGIPKTKLERIVVAYEPIWAIGTGKTATPADVHEMRLFIQKILARLYGRNYASKIRVLYGGSVHTKNAEELLSEGMIDGFLIGGASLKSDEFIEIVKIAKKHGT